MRTPAGSMGGLSSTVTGQAVIAEPPARDVALAEHALHVGLLDAGVIRSSTRRAGRRTPPFPHVTELANFRQVSARYAVYTSTAPPATSSTMPVIQAASPDAR